MLQWNYTQFSLQKLACNCHIFQKIAIYILTNEWQGYLLKLKKNKSYQNIKRLSHSFYNLKVKCISIFLFIYILCYSFVETIFNIDLWILVTKYTVILNFNFSFTIFSSLAHNATLNYTLLKNQAIQLIYIC